MLKILLPKQALLIPVESEHCTDCWFIQELLPPAHCPQLDCPLYYEQLARNTRDYYQLYMHTNPFLCTHVQTLCTMLLKHNISFVRSHFLRGVHMLFQKLVWTNEHFNLHFYVNILHCEEQSAPADGAITLVEFWNRYKVHSKSEVTKNLIFFYLPRQERRSYFLQETYK